MIEIDLSADLRPMLNRLQNVQRQIPFVIASSLTKTAVRVKPEIQAEMRRVFDRPTRYTLNSIFVKPASKQDENPTARVWLKDDSANDNRGGNAATYLWPSISGSSTRELTKFEIRLRDYGLLPDGMFVRPGSAAKIDSNGNVNTGQMSAILAYLKTIPEAIRSAKHRKRSTPYENARYFVASSKVYARNGLDIRQHLPLGIWERFPGRRIGIVYWYISRLQYRRIFEFDRVVREAALRILPEEFEAAIDRALREGE